VGRPIASISDIARLNDTLQYELRNAGRSGVTMFAISGVDLALWDALGKTEGATVAELIGVETSSSVPVYASLPRYGSRTDLVDRVERALTQGYRAIKLHQEEVGFVADARESAVGQASLMLDVSCGWTLERAHSMFRELAPYDLSWIEEPIFPPEDFTALASLRSPGSVPVAAGENICTSAQARSMLEARAVDIVQPSVTKAGGLTELLRIVDVARDEQVLVHPHSPYFGPGFLATLQVIACQLDGVAAIERYHVDLEASLYPGLLSSHAADLVVPTGRGLGRDPDPEVMSTYRLDV
jgi:L-alanine-DL-glutamate epimerase-like enolase superfamily enzyme